jgi:hypothetical protein
MHDPNLGGWKSEKLADEKPFQTRESKMNDNTTARQELQGIADAYHRMDELLAQNEELSSRADTAERQAEMLQRENEDLRREIKRTNSERDHYLRAFTALSSQLDGIGSSIVTAIRMSRVQAYGGRRPPSDAEEMFPRSETDGDMPTFLRRGPALAGRPSPPVSLETMRIAIEAMGEETREAG